MKSIRVETYSGYKADQEPRRVHLDDGVHEVADIGDRWYDPRYDYFSVRTTTGLRLLLRYGRREGRWWLVKRERLDA